MKKILNIPILLIFLLLPFAGLAQLQINQEKKQEVIDGLNENWTDWEKVTMSGKLKMRGLPLSPSLKIFMIKDSLISISLRAPFVGEAGKCEITPDSILAVNKMKKTYFKESLAEIFQYYPGGITDLQDLLLARIVFPGTEGYMIEDPEMVQVFMSDDGLALLPGEEIAAEGFSYGYILDDYFRPLTMLAVPNNFPDVLVSLIYSYESKGYSIDAAFTSNQYSLSALLQLDNPEFGKGDAELFRITSKFRRQSMRDFLRSF